MNLGGSDFDLCPGGATPLPACGPATTLRRLREINNERHQWMEPQRIVEDSEVLKRGRIFEALRQRAISSVAILDLTSPDLAKRQHQSWAWDASVMPAGGHYFPVFVDLLEHFERHEGIRPDTHVLVETTTGTAGVALGFIAKQLGYDVIIFMPEDMPARRIAAVRESLPSRQSELRFTPAGQYGKGLLRTFQKFLVDQHSRVGKVRSGSQTDKSFFPVNHSRRPEAILALFPIILRALNMLPPTSRINYTVAALGNGTSSTALFNAVQQLYPAAKRIGVEPIEAPTAYVRKFGQAQFVSEFGFRPRFESHGLLGTGGWGVSCPHLDVSAIDEVFPVTADSWRREQTVTAGRGLELGNSSAAVQAVVEMISARTSDAAANFFSIVYDKANMY